MKKNNIIFISIIIILIVLISIISSFSNQKNNLLNQTIISYGNSDQKCSTKLTKLNENDIIKEYDNYDYVKLDKITNSESISYKDLQNIISNTNQNKFEYGISLLDNQIILLSEEINANNIIDYDNYEINFDNLNKYLQRKKINHTINNISSLELLSTESKFLEDKNFIELNNVNGFNLRDINLNKDNLKNIIDNSAHLLMSMNSETGRFIYGIRTNSGIEINNYNILRHAGSTWSLILYYEQNPSEELKEIIDRSINYLLDNYIINYNDNISFVVEKKSDEIKLGGNALTLLMLSDYCEVFDDNKHNKIAEKIANGIIYMQEDNGEFYHILDTNGNKKEKYRTIYYDGEAVFSLLKFYETIDNKLYYNKAKKSIDMFLENNYESYRDHWISYSMNEFIRHNSDEKYIEFALDNYIYNIDRLDNNETFGPIRLELLLSVYDTYNYILKNKPDSEVIKNFDINQLKNSIEINLEVLFNYFINEETAMYFEKPDLSTYGFHDIESNFRMRIDDIQHPLIGLINYYKFFIQ